MNTLDNLHDIYVTYYGYKYEFSINRKYKFQLV